MSEVEQLRAEVERLTAERGMLARELSRWSQRAGRVEGVLLVVRDRLAYLQGLWGREAITQGIVDAIEALSRESEGQSRES